MRPCPRAALHLELVHAELVAAEAGAVHVERDFRLRGSLGRGHPALLCLRCSNATLPLRDRAATWQAPWELADDRVLARRATNTFPPTFISRGSPNSSYSAFCKHVFLRSCTLNHLRAGLQSIADDFKAIQAALQGPHDTTVTATTQLWQCTGVQGQPNWPAYCSGILISKPVQASWIAALFCTPSQSPLQVSIYLPALFASPQIRSDSEARLCARPCQAVLVSQQMHEPCLRCLCSLGTAIRLPCLLVTARCTVCTMEHLQLGNSQYYAACAAWQ